MYVSYEDYLTVKYGHPASTLELNEEEEESLEPISQEEYMRLSVWADALIDDWTLDRVGRAFECGHALPIQVVMLYCEIVDGLPELMQSSSEAAGARVSSFSNGVDSYSFDLTESASESLKASLAWMVSALPAPFSSRCFYSDEEPCHARRPR